MVTVAAVVRAAWDAAYINSLPDSAFAVVLPGGSKDDEGKTTPRDLRKLPHHDDQGALDLPHLRNALARLDGTNLAGKERAIAAAHLERHAKAEGIGGRSADSLVTIEAQIREEELEALAAYKAGLQDAPVFYRATVGPTGAQTLVASEESEDRLGDVISIDGWELDNFAKNPVYLFGHDHMIPPIGKVTRVWKDGKQLLNTVAWDEKDDFAKAIKGKYERGFMRAQSVGFRALEFEDRFAEDSRKSGILFTKQELLEISAVAVPAHPMALLKAYGRRYYFPDPPPQESPSNADIIRRMTEIFANEIKGERT